MKLILELKNIPIGLSVPSQKPVILQFYGLQNGGGETFERRHEFTGTYSYMAYAPEGSAESAGVWIITRINVAADGTTTKGTATGAWTNRYSLIYT